MSASRACGVNGRPLQLKFYNDQLDAQQTKQDAQKFVSQHVDIGWVTCDVDYSTRSIDEFLKAKILTVGLSAPTTRLATRMEFRA